MNSINVNDLNAILAALAACGVSVAVLTQWVKKFLTKEEKVIHTVLVALTFAGAALVQYHDHLPLKIGAVSLASVYGIATGLYNWSKLANGVLSNHYGQPSVEPAVTAALADVDKAVDDGKPVMAGVEAVAKDAKAVEEHVFAG